MARVWAGGWVYGQRGEGEGERKKRKILKIMYFTGFNSHTVGIVLN